MDLDNVKDELKSRIAKGLNFGVEAVEEVLQSDSDLYNPFILLKSKYNDLLYMSSLNTLSYEQLSLGLDRLRNNLIQIIDQLEAQHLGKETVEQSFNISALPTRRANFFKLLDIHYLNLNAISFVEHIGSEITNRQHGRKAVFELLQGHRRRFRNRQEFASEQATQAIKEHFSSWFQHEITGLEVYLKNIKHMLEYALASEIEQEFFLATLRSLFSRSEQAFILYYALSDLDPSFRDLVVNGKIVEESAKALLIREEDYKSLFG
ncbi:MAG: hypothetical protein AAFP77_29105 [Bacteroidota bacterium]